MKLFAQILSYLPSILAAIKGVEDALGPGNGAAKKQLVLNAVGAAAKGGENIPEQHVQAISLLIDATVATLNASGLFTKPIANQGTGRGLSGIGGIQSNQAVSVSPGI